MDSKPLIPNFLHLDRNDFSSFFAMMAKNVEDSLILSGAIPGKDYTILDIYKLAEPFVLVAWKQHDKTPLEFKMAWPQYDD